MGTTNKSKIDKNLTQKWVEYADANSAWDDLVTHGGGDYVPYKKIVLRLYKEVKASHGKKFADLMNEWAREYHERSYYRRGLTKAQLCAKLPPEIDEQTVRYERFGERPPKPPKVVTILINEEQQAIGVQFTANNERGKLGTLKKTLIKTLKRYGYRIE